MQLELGQTRRIAVLGRISFAMMLIVCQFRPRIERHPSRTKRSGREDSVRLDAPRERYRRGKIEGALGLVATEAEPSSGFASNDAGSS